MGKHSQHRQAALIVIMVIGLALGASAQMSNDADLERASQQSGLGIPAVSNPFSLLDFSRISWSHSYSASYFSGGGYSGSAGLFRTNMFYELSSKLSLNLNLGIAHTGSLFSSTDRETTVLPGFTLDYHPSDKFQVTLMFQKYSGYVNPYEYRSGLWHNSVGP